MPDGIGVLSKCGIKEASAWGEAWSAVDTMLPINDESLITTIQRIETMALEGVAGRRVGKQGLVEVAGALNSDLDYYNFGSILEAAMGTDTTGVYTLADNNTKIIKIEFEKAVSRWRINSAKIQKMTISGNKGEALKIATDIIGMTPSRSATAFPSISLSSYSQVLFSNSVSASFIRIGNQDDALDSGDNIDAESFSLELTNNFKADDYSSLSRYALDPLRNGKRDVVFNVKLPRYSADTIPDWKDAGTPLQATLYFTDGTKTLLIEIPEFEISEGFNMNIGGSEILVQEGPGNCYLNSSNTPMTAISSEFRITIT
ncbi:MAG TPA: phage tail tube protein [Williamwhitmania sp.]|nr:phage tail tube protein [Williamwhitmania sp.]